MTHPEQQYLDLMKELLEKGDRQVDAGHGKATIGVLIKQYIPAVARIPVIKKVNTVFRREKEMMLFISLSMCRYRCQCQWSVTTGQYLVGCRG